MLIGAVQDLSELEPTVAEYLNGNAESRGPTFQANQHRTQHRCDGPEHLPGAVVLDCGSAYASKSFTDQQGRRISWSWLPDYGGPATPQLRYNGTLTLPRVLTVEQHELRSRSVYKSTTASGAPDNSSLSRFSAMARPSWLGRAVRNEQHHAIEQASRQ